MFPIFAVKFHKISDHLMQKFTLPLFVFFLWFGSCTHPQVTDTLPRSTPEKEGISSRGILNFIEAVEQSGVELHSFMLLRHGKVVAEGWWNPYHPDLKHMIYSTSKTFTSTAVGFAISEGKLSVNDKVISFFPESLPDTVSENLATMRVKDLLCMTAGQNPEPLGIVRGQEWVKDFLANPVADKPGTKFLYNSVATYMLSAIVQKVTGEKLIDYLTPRLFDPLAIREADWEVDPKGINTGGWGLRLKTEDMAKLGQLYLQKGRWNGQQLLPAGWIEEATAAKIIQKPGISEEQRNADDWAQGYCYQMWRCRNNAFRADGAFGQFIIVMPDMDAVVAITANAYDLQKEINFVWDYLLPAMHEKSLLPDRETETALRQKLASLAIPPPAKGINSHLETEFSQEINFILDSDENFRRTFSLRFENNICHVVIDADSASFPLEFGKETWKTGETVKPCPYIIPSVSNFKGLPPFKVCGSYCWEDANTLSLTLRYIESPHYEMITCRFDGDRIIVTMADSINRKVELEGKRQ
jgi:CubicO group peptidase (beta-lactamase class C family)